MTSQIRDTTPFRAVATRGHLAVAARARLGVAARARLAVAALGAIGALAAVAALPGTAGAAIRHLTTSANWSGYAIHGDGQNFTRATGIWTVPRPKCTAGHPTYSAAWVGIGGYDLNAKHLEQTGTETDCKRNGSRRTTAWFEVVPAPSRAAHLSVHPGDVVAATVTVKGTEVTMTLRDLTTHRHFTKKVDANGVDTSSAEWIVEAPSDCSSSTDCNTLPLADFGNVRFTHVSVTTSTGRIGTISNSHWHRTKIRLSSLSRAHFAATGTVAQATPSALGRAGAAFSVAYSSRDSGIGIPTGPGLGGHGGGLPPGFPGGYDIRR